MLNIVIESVRGGKKAVKDVCDFFWVLYLKNAQKHLNGTSYINNKKK